MGFTPSRTYSGAWNTGTDLSVEIVDNLTGNSVAFGGRNTSFKVTSKDEVMTGTGLDNGGRVDHQVIPGGLTGTIIIRRYDGSLFLVKKFLDANYYSGNDQRYYTITRTIVNRSASALTKVDEDVFTNCVLVIDDGEWSANKEVPMTITFSGSETK